MAFNDFELSRSKVLLRDDARLLQAYKSMKVKSFILSSQHFGQVLGEFKNSLCLFQQCYGSGPRRWILRLRWRRWRSSTSLVVWRAYLRVARIHVVRLRKTNSLLHPHEQIWLVSTRFGSKFLPKLHQIGFPQSKQHILQFSASLEDFSGLTIASNQLESLQCECCCQQVFANISSLRNVCDVS